MKKNFPSIFSLKALLLACTLSTQPISQAQILKPIGDYSLTAESSTSAVRTIVAEDFAGFKAGSEDQPNDTNIANLRTGLIESSFTTLPGWTGAAIYQAGGKCLISLGSYYGDEGSYEDTGFIRTPVGDYAGDLTVKFSARLYESAVNSDQMAVILNSTAGRIEAKTVTVTPEWNDFTVTFSKGLFEGCVVELSMKAEKVLIDDLTVTSVATSIPAPVATPATAFTEDGFTANWNATKEAESYLLTLYRRDTEKAKTVVDFEDLNVLPDGVHLDTNNPGTPEGWQINLANGSGDHVSDKGYEGSRGIVIDEDAEGFVTPYFDRDIRDFTFYARYLAGQPCFSQLRVLVNIGGTWQALGNVDIERISSNGEIINFSSRIPDGVRQIEVFVKKNATNDAGKDLSVVIDHVFVMTDPESVPAITDIETTSTSYTFTGLDPETDYSYSVKAVNASFKSLESKEMVALGLASPTLLPANDFKNGGYTASWNASPKAEGYVVSNYRVYTAPEDEEVTLLFEDFNKVTQGTLEKPVGLYNTFNPASLDKYTTTPGWLGLCNYLVNGMMGSRSYYTVKGSIQTPAMNLSGNEGKFRVYLTLVGDVDAVGDSIVVQAGAKAFQRQLISDSEALDLIFDFDCGESEMPLLIYSYGGNPFYIDEISVTQYLSKGSQIFTETENKTVIGHDNNSIRFDGLTAGENESFAFRVFAYRDFYGSRIYSVSDAAMHVLSTSGIEDEITKDGNDAPIEYFNLQGVRVDRPENGVYIMRQGNMTSKVFIK